jgi:hypothetical protein
MADIQYIAQNANGVNVAEINGQTVDSKTNGETAIGAGFILGITNGVPTISIKATSVVPVVGHSIDLMALHVAQTEFPVAFNYNGKVYVFPAKITELSVKSEAKNGMVTGDITFTQAGPMVSI